MSTTIEPRGIILSHSVDPIQCDPATGLPIPMDAIASALFESLTGHSVTTATPKIGARLTCQRFYGLGKSSKLSSDHNGSRLELLSGRKTEMDGLGHYKIKRTITILEGGTVLSQESGQDQEHMIGPQGDALTNYYTRSQSAVDSYKLRKGINAWIKALGAVPLSKSGPYWLPIECLDHVEEVAACASKLGAHISCAVIDQSSLEGHARAAMGRLASINHDIRSELETLANEGDQDGAIKRLNEWRSEVQGASTLLDAMSEAKGTLDGLYDSAMEAIMGQGMEDLTDLIEEPTEPVEGFDIGEADPEPEPEPEPTTPEQDPEDLDLDFL